MGKVKGKIHSLQHLRMLVLHVPLQVEFFELGETAEAEEADDFPAQIVAEVSFGPQPLEGAAIVDSRSDPLRIPKKSRKVLLKSKYWLRALYTAKTRSF